MSDPLARTQWSCIRQLEGPATQDPDAQRTWEDAWEYLWLRFRPAMLRTVRKMLSRVGGAVAGADEAEDVVQSFFLACLEKGYLAQADPGLGRFRTFVGVCLRRHTMNFLQYRRRLRRFPASPVLSLSECVCRSSDVREWDALLEDEWVRCLLDTAVPRVGERSRPNEELLRILCAAPEIEASELALRLGIDRSKVPLRLHRARRMLAEELWDVVEQTVSNQAELDEERATLGRVLDCHLGVRDVPPLFGDESS